MSCEVRHCVTRHGKRYGIRSDASQWMNAARYSVEARPDLQCTATSKQTGRRCRKCRAPGFTVCCNHGGGGRMKNDKTRVAPPSGPRNERNRMAKMARRALSKAAEDVPQEVWTEFNRNWAQRIADTDHNAFAIVLWMRMEGRMTTQEWVEQQVRFGLLKQS